MQKAAFEAATWQKADAHVLAESFATLPQSDKGRVADIHQPIEDCILVMFEHGYSHYLLLDLTYRNGRRRVISVLLSPLCCKSTSSVWELRIFVKAR